MKRPSLPGLDVGGAWKIPIRAEIEVFELAYILEVPEQEVRNLFGAEVPVRAARDLLRKLAGQGRLEGSDETSLFGRLITGAAHIDRDGNVFSAVEGRPFGQVREATPRHEP